MEMCGFEPSNLRWFEEITKVYVSFAVVNKQGCTVPRDQDQLVISFPEDILDLPKSGLR